MYQITRKTFLARNLKRLQKLFPLEYDFFPKTWIIPYEFNDLKSYALQPQIVQQPQKSARQAKMTIAEKLENIERQLGHDLINSQEDMPGNPNQKSKRGEKQT